MIRKQKGLVRHAFLIVATCLAAALSWSAELDQSSQPPTGALQEGIICADDKLTINVDSVEIAQLLRMLSVKRRASIVAGPRVSGKISVNLYDVTFEEALRSILDVSGCTATHKGNVILVTEASEKARLPLNATDMEIKVFKLDYADPNEAFDLVKEFVSPAGKAMASVAESTLLIEDTSAYLDRISSLIEQIDVPPKQVLIEARLLELSYTDDLTVGVQIEGIKINGDTIFRALTNGFATNFNLIPEGAQGLFAGVLTDDTATFIEALAERVDVKTLANPKILAVHNQEAEIIIGDRLGFRITTTTETSSLESVEFLDVGTQLTLTPQISDDGLVLLKIHPEVSSGNISAAGLPAESTAEATTYMLVRDGQTVVLGGLLKETDTRRVVKVPLLGDIPWLGHLFRRTQKGTSRSELVVLITPHIVGADPDESMQEVISAAEGMSSSADCGALVGDRETDCKQAQVPPFRPARSGHTKEPLSPEPVIAEPGGTVPAPADAAGEERAGRATAIARKPQLPAYPRGGCCIQALASRNGEVARDYVTKLERAGFLGWVKPPDRRAGDRWYRAMIGPFSTRTEAEETLEELKEHKELADAFIRPVG